MQFPESWLRTLVDPPLTSAELSHQLTMAGLEVEALVPAAPDFSSVVVGEILSAERHPDADRLQVCRVDAGGPEPLQIVCGAPNARAGLKTACALAGARLPGFEIKCAKVRGVESAGMLCSAKELGIDAAADGILEFAADAPVGRPVRAWLDLDDRIFTLKLTPNRGDCLSLTGVAREVAAITGAPLTAAQNPPVAAAHGESPSITVPAPAACPVYCGRIVSGVRAAAPTPDWMVRRLARCGVRSISAVVDITNYVLLELGQPMHAFDRAKLQGGLQVRWAKSGEALELLNGQRVEPDGQTLVIADATGPVALAGIMGGQSSAVSDETTVILLEAAHFTPASLAGRARQYGLATDSSHRFERGVDPDLPRGAMERATRLIIDICGGVAGPVLEAAAERPPRPPIRFRPERARRLLGVQIDDVAIAAHFARLGLIHTATQESWTVRVPSHRFDLNIEADLIEEIARLQGYDRLPSVFPRGEARMRAASETVRSLLDVKKQLVARGWQEIIAYSFIAPEEAEPFAQGQAPIELLNPIASQMSVMRPSLLPGLLQTLRHNLNHGQERLRLFEAGRCFTGIEAGAQPLRLSGLAYGLTRPEQWGEPGGRKVDFYDVKADIEALLGHGPLAWRAEAHPALHPGQCARLYLGGVAVGWLGALHPRQVQALGLAQAPVLFELEIAGVLGRDLPRHQRMARLPGVRRDIAVLVDEAVRVGEMLDAVRNPLPGKVVACDLFDVYRGPGVPPGKKSLAFKIVLQDTEKTLTETEIEAAVAGVLEVLGSRFGAIIRGESE